MEHSADGSVDGLVATFYNTILVMGFGASRDDLKVEFNLKEIPDLGVTKEFATLIHIDIAPSELRRDVTMEPAAKPIDRGTFADAGNTMEGFGVVVGDEKIAGLTIEAEKILVVGRVLGALTRKGKVDREALTGASSFARGGVSTGSLVELGFEAYRAVLKDRLGDVELGDTMGKEMGTGKLGIRTVAKALVPKEAFSFGRNAVEDKFIGDIVVGMIHGERARLSHRKGGVEGLRNQNWASVAERVVNGTTNSDTLGRLKLVNGMECEGGLGLIEVKGIAAIDGRTKEDLEGARGDNGIGESRGVVARERGKSARCVSRDTEDSNTVRMLRDAVSTDKANGSRVVRSVGAVTPKQVAKMSSRGLGTIVKMSLRGGRGSWDTSTELGEMEILGRKSRRRRMEDGRDMGHKDAIDSDRGKGGVIQKEVLERGTVRVIRRNGRKIGSGCCDNSGIINSRITWKGGRQLQGWRIRCPASMCGSLL